MFVVELLGDDITVCRKNGSSISPRSRLAKDLLDCNRSGDCEPACRYVLSEHKPEFRVIKKIDGKYENILANNQDKAAVCRAIYFESESDFDGDESLCDAYLIWQAASSFESELLDRGVTAPDR